MLLVKIKKTSKSTGHKHYLPTNLETRWFRPCKKDYKVLKTVFHVMIILRKVKMNFITHDIEMNACKKI